MRGLITIFSSLALVVLAGQASAQSARKMAEHGDWATYSYQAQNGKVCYVLTVPKPKSMQPASVDHGDMFFFVSQRPGQAVSFEPQFIAGYALREGSKVSVAIGAKKMSAAQAQQIEEHTGVPPEELEDDDLSEAMQELNIPDVEADPSELS